MAATLGFPPMMEPPAKRARADEEGKAVCQPYAHHHEGMMGADPRLLTTLPAAPSQQQQQINFMSGLGELASHAVQAQQPLVAQTTTMGGGQGGGGPLGNGGEGHGVRNVNQHGLPGYPEGYTQGFLAGVAYCQQTMNLQATRDIVAIPTDDGAGSALVAIPNSGPGAPPDTWKKASLTRRPYRCGPRPGLAPCRLLGLCGSLRSFLSPCSFAHSRGWYDISSLLVG